MSDFQKPEQMIHLSHMMLNELVMCIPDPDGTKIDFQCSHRFEKYLNIHVQDCLEKYLKVTFAFKST